MDILSKDQRHKNMAAIHSANTKPEMIVRKYLFAHGFRYRLNHPRLPGRPDIVLRKYRTCIFINGCFWHGHEGCKYYVIPKSNTEFWTRKITRNIERDKQVQQELARMGWHCMTIWECELKPKKREQTLLALEYTLNHIYLKDHTVSYSFDEEEKPLMAAEESEDTYHTLKKIPHNMNSFIPIFSAFFILLGLLVWRFPKLIAGYNTMTPEQQKKVDVKGLKAFMCRVFCAIGILVFVSYLLLRLFMDEASAINISSIVVPIIGVIYLLAGGQRYDHN